MKKTYAFLATLLLASGVARPEPDGLLHGGNDLPQPVQPAFAPLRGYVNIPGLGGIDINASGNLAVDKLLYPRNGKLVTLLDEPFRPDRRFRDSRPTTCWASTPA